MPGVSANAYIMMPENAGIAVLAHEFGHNLGAMDLYTYGDGQTSAGFWTLMSDSWVGFPLGYLPEAMDPMHLDQWGWLNPLTISDPARVYTVTLGQASRFPGNSEAVRAVKIQLPDAHRAAAGATARFLAMVGGRSIAHHGVHDAQAVDPDSRRWRHAGIPNRIRYGSGLRLFLRRGLHQRRSLLATARPVGRHEPGFSGLPGADFLAGELRQPRSARALPLYDRQLHRRGRHVCR